MARQIAGIYKLLTSPSLAVTVFLMITLSSAAGALADSEPAKRVFSGLVAGNKIFASCWFLILNMILLVITLLCACRQAGTGLSRWRKFSGHAGDRGSEACNGEFADEVYNILRKNRYAVRKNTDSCWIGQKNRSGIFGAVLFHFGLLVLVLGVLIDVFAGFTGNLALRPSLITGDRSENYITVDKRVIDPGVLGRFQILLHEVKMKYDDNGVDASGLVSVIVNGQVVKQGTIDRNNPLNFSTMALLKDAYGYYVNYMILDKDGNVVANHALGLDTKENDSSTEYIRLNYQQPNTPYNLAVRFFPDAIRKGKTFTTRTYEPKNPAVLLDIKYADKKLYYGLLKTGDEITMDNGQRFVFRGVTPYLLVRVQWMLGSYVVAGGFAVFLTGLILYYFFIPSIIVVKKGQTGYFVEFIAWTGRETVKRQVQEITDRLNLMTREVT